MSKLFVVLPLVFYFSLAANARKMTFPCSLAPGMQGVLCKAEFRTRDDGNNRIKIKMEHLPHPWRLQPPKRSYLIWLQRLDSQPKVQTVLVADPDRKAEFDTTVRAVDFNVFVTAEEEDAPESPHGPSVITVAIRNIARHQHWIASVRDRVVSWLEDKLFGLRLEQSNTQLAECVLRRFELGIATSR